MTPPVAITLVYVIVGGGIILYLRRMRRRLREVEADLEARATPKHTMSGEVLPTR